MCLIFSYLYLMDGQSRRVAAGGSCPSLARLADHGNRSVCGGSALIILAGRVARAHAGDKLVADASCSSPGLAADVRRLRGSTVWAVAERASRGCASGYGAVIYTFVALQGFFVAVMTIMVLYTLARSLCGLLNGVRRATFDNTMLLWHYTTAQGLVAIAISRFFHGSLG